MRLRKGKTARADYFWCAGDKTSWTPRLNFESSILNAALLPNFKTLEAFRFGSNSEVHAHMSAWVVFRSTCDLVSLQHSLQDWGGRGGGNPEKIWSRLSVAQPSWFIRTWRTRALAKSLHFQNTDFFYIHFHAWHLAWVTAAENNGKVVFTPTLPDNRKGILCLTTFSQASLVKSAVFWDTTIHPPVLLLIVVVKVMVVVVMVVKGPITDPSDT